MSDNLRDISRQDDIRINMNQPHEITYWTYKLRVTETELKEAIKQVGSMADKVEEYFRDQKGQRIQTG